MNTPLSQELMCFHDGELDAEERAAIEALLLTDPDARAQLQGLQQLSSFVGAHFDAVSAAAPDLSAEIMARVEREQLPAVPAPSARVGRRALPRWLAGVGVGTALAAAAAVLLTLASSAEDERSVEGASGPSGAPQQTAARPTGLPSRAVSPALAVREEESSVAFVSVDLGNGGGTVFLVGEESTPVLWLNDDGLPTEQRMGPL